MRVEAVIHLTCVKRPYHGENFFSGKNLQRSPLAAWQPGVKGRCGAVANVGFVWSHHPQVQFGRASRTAVVPHADVRVSFTNTCIICLFSPCVYDTNHT